MRAQVLAREGFWLLAFGWSEPGSSGRHIPWMGSGHFFCRNVQGVTRKSGGWGRGARGGVVVCLSVLRDHQSDHFRCLEDVSTVVLFGFGCEGGVSLALGGTLTLWFSILWSFEGVPHMRLAVP